MTTLMKGTFAGLLILAGAPAILTQAAWREGQQTDDLHPALLPVPGRSQHRGSMSAFALDEPFLRQGAARPRRPLPVRRGSATSGRSSRNPTASAPMRCWTFAS